MLRELAFVDPGIHEPGTVLKGLRPGVEGILLSPSRDALEQIAQALAARAGIDIIHIVAHGKPGELSFAAGALTLDTLPAHAGELAAIGDALAPNGRLLLWSCETGAGWRGACFVEALERATGAEVAAATGLVGAAAKGGSWDFGTNSFIAAQAPLTTEAIQTYEGVMAVTGFSVSGAGDGFLNASEIASGYALSYGLNNTGSFGGDVLVLIKDGSGNLLYWYTETSATAATIPAGALGTYQGTIQIQAYQGTAQTDGASSTNFAGTFKTYPTSSQFTFHDASLGGGNTAVTSGTTADATTGAITLDTVLPTVTVNIVDTSLSDGDTSSVVNFTFSEATTNFTAADVTVVGGTLGTITGSGTNYSATFTATDGFSGTGSVSVNAGSYTDAAGNTGATGSDTVAIDRLNPTVTVNIVDTSLSDGDTSSVVNFTFSEATTNFTAADVTVVGGTLGTITGSGTNYSATFTATDGFSGTGSVSVNAGSYTDAAGNTGATGSDTVAIDRLNPTVTVNIVDTSLSDGDTSSVVNFTFSEATTNFTAADVTVVGGTLGTITGSGTNYSATFTATDGFSGTGSVSVNAGSYTDAAGNTGATGSDTVAIDRLNPTVTVNIVDTSLSDGDTSSVVNFTFSEATTDFTAADVTVVGGTLGTITGSGTNYSATFTATDGFSGTGSVSVNAGSYTDAAGNTGATGSDTVAIDRLNPTVTVNIVDTSLSDGDTSSVVNFTFSEATTNFTAADVTVVGGTLGTITGSGTNYSATFTATDGFSGTGSVSVNAGSYTDAAGNTGATGSDTVAIDRLNPTVVIGTDDSALKIGDVAHLTFTLSEASTTFTSGDIVVTGGSLSNFAGSGTSYTADFTPTPGSTTSATVNVAGSTFTDAAGNNNTAAAQLTMTVDTVAPAAGTLSFDNLIDTGSTDATPITSDNNFDLTLAGQEGGATVAYEVSVNGDAFVSTGAVQTGLADGDYQFRAVVTDAAGNSSTSNVIGVVIDNTPPDAPVVTSIEDDTGSSDGVTSDTSLTIHGTAEANSVVEVFRDGDSIGTATADGSGNWILADPDTLADGTSYVYTATATDAAGNASDASEDFAVTIDTAVPDAPGVALSNDSGTDGDLLTNDGTLSLSGVEEGALVEYSTDGGDNWSATAPTYANDGSDDGSHTVDVRQTDVAGNVSAPASITFTLDTLIDTPSVALSNDSGSSGADLITNDASLTVSEPAGDVTRVFVVDGEDSSETYTAPTDQGEHTVQVIDTDAAGNTANTSISFTLDTINPDAPGVSLSDDTGSSGADLLTNDGTLSLAGVEGGAVVEYSTDGGDTWSETFSAVEGANDVLVRQTDVAGNVSDPTSFSFTLDTINPDALGVALSNDTGSSGGDLVTNDGTLSLSGVESGAVVEYSTDGGDTWDTAFSAVEGANDVLVRQTDVAGNVSDPTSFSFTLDTTNPDAPGVALSNDTGSSGGDLLTNDGTLSLSGVEAGAVVEYSTDGGDTWSETFTAVEGTNDVQVRQTDVAGNQSDPTAFSFTLDTTNPDAPGVALSNDSGSDGGDLLTNDGTLSLTGVESGAVVEYSTDGGGTWDTAFTPVEGTNDVQVRQTDVAGNVSDPTAFSFTLDTTNPDAPGVSLSNDTGSSGADLLTNDGTLSLSGVESGALVEYSTDGGDTWSETFSAVEGANDVLVRQTDVAGNQSDPTAFSFTLDTTNPDAPGVALSNDTGSSGGDLVTNDGTLSLSGVESGALVEYSTDGGDTWDTAFTPVEGTNDVQVRQTDVAGNVSDPTLFSFTLDTTEPDAPGVALSNDSGTDGDLLTNDGTLSLSGVESGALVEYSTDGGSSWSATAPTYANDGSDDGSHTVDVRQTDVAGNVSAPASITFSLDTIAPDAVAEVTAISDDSGPDPADFVTNIAAQIVSGTFTGTLGVGETIQVSADGSTWIDAVTSGSDWTASGVTLASGTNTLSVRAIDAAGNITSGTGHGYTLDTVVAAPTVTLLHDTGTDGDLITNDGTLSLGGVEEDALIEYSLNGVDWSTTVPTYANDGSDDGEHTVQVRQTDIAGNLSDPGSITFTLDTIAPDAPSIDGFAEDSGTQGDHRTNDATPTLAIAAAAGSIVEIFRDGDSVGFATEGAPGSFSFTSEEDLDDGDYSFTAKAIDLAGNASEISGEFAISIETAPSLPAVIGGVIENAPENTVAGVLLASDDDIFTFIPDPANPFKIVYNSTAHQYEIQTTAPLDFEQQAEWVFDVQAHNTVTDNESTVGVTVFVGNVEGVTIDGNKKNNVINATKSVGNQSLPTGEEDIINGKGGNDKISGLGGNDTLNGGAGKDTLNGGDGIDTLKGGAGNDKLVGGLGQDALFGNAGADKFVFSTLLDSSVSAPDQINDFKHGQHDKIVLKAIDANDLIAGDQAFHYIGGQAFTGGDHAGELRFDTVTRLLEGDVDGDGDADFAIHVNVAHLVKGDFVL